MPLFSDPPSQYHSVDHYTGRIIPNVPMSRNVKRFSEFKKELTRKDIPLKNPTCPKWIKLLINVFSHRT